MKKFNLTTDQIEVNKGYFVLRSRIHVGVTHLKWI